MKVEVARLGVSYAQNDPRRRSCAQDQTRTRSCDISCDMARMPLSTKGGVRDVVWSGGSAGRESGICSDWAYRCGHAPRGTTVARPSGQSGENSEVRPVSSGIVS